MQNKDEFDFGGHVSYVMNAGDLTNANLSAVLNSRGPHAHARLLQLKQDNSPNVAGNFKTLSFYHNNANTRSMVQNSKVTFNPPNKKDGSNDAYYEVVKEWLN